jgi:hypothetical protein
VTPLLPDDPKSRIAPSEATMTTTESTGSSERLRAKLAPLQAEMATRSQLMIEHGDSRGLYPALLQMLYSSVRASVPIMESAMEAAENRAPQDLVAAGLVPYLAESTSKRSVTTTSGSSRTGPFSGGTHSI